MGREQKEKFQIVQHKRQDTAVTEEVRLGGSETETEAEAKDHRETTIHHRLVAWSSGGQIVQKYC